MDLVLDVSLTDDELGTVDFSSAGWVTESTLTFEVHAIAAATHSVCWAEAKLRIALLEIKEPPLFRSELHLTTSLPKTLAPSVLAFQSNAAAHGVTRIALAFRDQQLLGGNAFGCSM
ncbi:unnamed protein product [Durusdinium trenchii]|uniref:Uncharacterized protein n=1 Tax=Durusdinium trenchii TaxID=1381693 RepID=A0ABP0I086_9DINO